MLSANRSRSGSLAKLAQTPTTPTTPPPATPALTLQQPQTPEASSRSRMPSAGRTGIDLRKSVVSEQSTKPRARSAGKHDEVLSALRNASLVTRLDLAPESEIPVISTPISSYHSALISNAKKLLSEHTAILALADVHQNPKDRYQFMRNLQSERIKHYCTPESIFTKISDAINKLEKKSSEDSPELNALRELKMKLADQYKALTIAFDRAEKAVLNDPLDGALDSRITGLYEFQKIIMNELERLAIRADIFVPFQKTESLHQIDPERSAYGAIRSCYPFSEGLEQREQHYIDAVKNYSAQEASQVNELVAIAGDVFAAVAALSNSLKKFDATQTEDRNESLMTFLLSIQIPYDEIIVKLKGCKCFPQSLAAVLVKTLESEKKIIEMLIQHFENKALQDFLNPRRARNSAAKLDEVTQCYASVAKTFYSSLDDLKFESALCAELAKITAPLQRSASFAEFDVKLDEVLAAMGKPLPGVSPEEAPLVPPSITKLGHSMAELIAKHGISKSPNEESVDAEHRESSTPAAKPF